MKTIYQYIDHIVDGLPMDNAEREELRLEMTSHLEEHAKELMAFGWSEEEAAGEAIRCFGNEKRISSELKKAVFPFYKIFRFLFSTIFLTAALHLLSYEAMVYYNPQYEFGLEPGYLFTTYMLVFFLAGIAEILYEAVSQAYNVKWLQSPWVVILVPAAFISGLTSLDWFKQPERYQNGLWLDLFAILIGAFIYLLARQLYTLLFLSGKGNAGSAGHR
ncbi:permease prefix domain 1-containing protein [Bacillus infantis]|uniref:permease prefix domain 1-containing protein n=1 Tax=Bacillus infantis TaxID=324767 RepID=UPI003CF90504